MEDSFLRGTGGEVLRGGLEWYRDILISLGISFDLPFVQRK